MLDFNLTYPTPFCMFWRSLWTEHGWHLYQPARVACSWLMITQATTRLAPLFGWFQCASTKVCWWSCLGLITAQDKTAVRLRWHYKPLCDWDERCFQVASVGKYDSSLSSQVDSIEFLWLKLGISGQLRFQAFTVRLFAVPAEGTGRILCDYDDHGWFREMFRFVVRIGL